MRKYLLLFIITIFVMSCSKKVDVKGKITGGSPLERIELIEASGVATLPLVNLGLDKDGNFSGSFDAPKNGMYEISYGGKRNIIYLKAGQTLNISGNGATFPTEYIITGDAKKNNDFFVATQKYLVNYAQKINIQELMARDEKTFLQGVQKIEGDIKTNIEENIKKFNPDNDVVEWKKIDVASTILSVMAQYEMVKKMSGDPSFKVSKAFTDFENKLQQDKDKMLKISPTYRSYLLNKYNSDFQKFAEPRASKNPSVTLSELFTEFMKSKKDTPQLTKDYLLSFVIAQDIRPGIDPKALDKISKIIDDNIKDNEIKKGLKNIELAIAGNKIGTVAPEAPLVKQDGKAYNLSENKGKPYMLFFYASWNPYISEATVPVLKEVVNFYKSKMNFVFVNVDDTKDQFVKTSNSLLKGIQGVNVYGEKGMESEIAKKYGVYGFKLPCFVIIDKDGKIASRSFVNLGEQELVTILDKLTGLAAPRVDQAPQQMPQGLQVDPSAQQQAPQPANPQPAQTK
ncbi:TlpA family protein disulfide reductase [Chryseobacterium rhizosphaerae]|uniref:TlpA family protein disulfide reductase n=1 Tax=Chryseobacterium rhizosphaerae TaxID=395937 RepID=A0ABX9ISF5_9FLAO|nr:TlpA disulfide reductase family protein [Chryseobacterium rhizosphaerae]REC78857.1 TlpA family protein disulfide reductase [Chryseobacterium rhizosphaerae]